MVGACAEFGVEPREPSPPTRGRDRRSGLAPDQSISETAVNAAVDRSRPCHSHTGELDRIGHARGLVRRAERVAVPELRLDQRAGSRVVQGLRAGRAPERVQVLGERRRRTRRSCPMPISVPARATRGHDAQEARPVAPGVRLAAVGAEEEQPVLAAFHARRRRAEARGRRGAGRAAGLSSAVAAARRRARGAVALRRAAARGREPRDARGHDLACPSEVPTREQRRPERRAVVVLGEGTDGVAELRFDHAPPRSVPARQVPGEVTSGVERRCRPRPLLDHRERAHDAVQPSAGRGPLLSIPAGDVGRGHAAGDREGPSHEERRPRPVVEGPQGIHRPAGDASAHRGPGRAIP